MCSRSTARQFEQQQARQSSFLRFDNDVARTVTDSSATALWRAMARSRATDPDIFVLRRGVLAAFGAGTRSATRRSRRSRYRLGIYILEVYDFDIDRVPGTAPRCMTVSVTSGLRDSAHTIGA